MAAFVAVVVIGNLYIAHLKLSSCRHTFATLLKRTEGAEKDKPSLIGHANEEQLRYYQDVKFVDLRKITDRI